MRILALLLIYALPSLGLLVLFFAMSKWGRKHDPMGGYARNIWRTTGSTHRSSRIDR